MKKLILALGLLAAAAPAHAGIFWDIGVSASSATLRMVGAIKMYAANAYNGSPVLTLDSVAGTIATSMTASFTATGNGTYDVTTSSGIKSNAGTIYGNFIQAANGFFGSLTGPVTGNVTGNLTGNVTGNVTGTSSLATALAGGGIAQLAFQSASGVTAFLAAGTDGQILSMNGTTAFGWRSSLPNAVTISTQNVTQGFNGANQFDQVGAGGALSESVKVSTANIRSGFNGASQLVQMDGSAKLPAIDGSQLTGVSGVLAGGTAGYDGKWTAANAQTAGNFYHSSTGTTCNLPILFTAPITGPVMVLVGSGTFSAAASMTISGLTGDTNYVVYYNFVPGTTAINPWLQFNGLSAGYAWLTITNFANSVASTSSQSDSKVYLGGTTYGCANNSTTMGHIEFASVNAQAVTAFTYQNSCFSGGNGHVAAHGGGEIGSNPTSVQILPSAGTITGRMWVYKVQ